MDHLPNKHIVLKYPGNVRAEERILHKLIDVQALSLVHCYSLPLTEMLLIVLEILFNYFIILISDIVSLCIMSVSGVFGSQKRVLDSLVLELQTAVMLPCTYRESNPSPPEDQQAF